MSLEDARAAVGFFGRADEVSPNNGRVKAGLGRAMLEMQQTGDALRLLEQAGTLGYSDPEMLSDRGLARDLTGDQAGAQRDYVAALRSRPNDQTLIRRYAVSLGISGQIDLAEKTIQPLLYKSDRGAWRDRAFILAMNGRQEQARTITTQVMPRPLADAIQPYMERMGMLTPAQRAAAVHMGQFPPGLVKVRVASTAVPAPASTPTASAVASNTKRPTARGSRTTPTLAATSPVVQPMPPTYTPPQSPTLSGRAVESDPVRSSAPVRAAQAASAPSTAQVPPVIDYSDAPPTNMARPAPARVEPVRSQPVSQQPVRPAPANVTPAPTAPATSAAAASAVPSAPSAATPQPITPRPVNPAPTYGPPAPQPSAQPSFAQPSSAPPAPAPAAPASVPQTAPTSNRTLAQIMAEVQVPEAEQAASAAALDLVEIMRVQAERRKAKLAAEAKAKKDVAAKEKAAAEAKAKAEALAEKKRLAANPSRIWVQVGTGRDKSALAFTLKAMRKKYADTMGSRDGWTAEWGRTNRLVVGPFSSKAKAQDFEASMKKAGSDAFLWVSDAGEDVSALGGK
nr:SPOR domain-containing protein [Sphingobium subterraneum]